MWQNTKESNAKVVVASAILISCSACERDMSRDMTRDAATPSAPPATETLPAGGAFVGRAWIGTSSGPERGSVMIFLPDRTLVRDPCPGPLSVTQWGVVDGRVRWTEPPGSIPIEADVILPGRDELRLGIVGRDQETYLAASPPFACPEMPAG